MGCDIHLFVEARKSATEPWELVAIKSRCSWCHGDKVLKGGGVCYGCQGTGEALGFDDRSYDTFAILADVRNGRGFAGCDTGDGFEPIADQRGLPSDMSTELRELQKAHEVVQDYDALDAVTQSFAERFGACSLGDHSFSHLSLRELTTCNWNRRTNRRGVVKARGFQTFLEHGAPSEWSGDISGPAVVFVSNEQMRELVERCTFTDDDWSDVERVSAGPEIVCMRGRPQNTWYVTRIQWSVSYKETSRQFYEHFMPALCKFAERNGVTQDDVRIVFGFDS